MTDEVGRLIGEKDVLSAINSEYLDEFSTKKEHSAAIICFGKVLMTTYRLQFVPDTNEYHLLKRHLLDRTEEEIQSYFTIPLGSIATINKKNIVIEISTKDLRQFSFRFDSVEVMRIHGAIMTYVFPDKIDYLFAFYHRLSHDYCEEDECIPMGQDWDLFNAQKEYERQGVFQTDKWRLSNVNERFNLIETYPEQLLVPSCIPDVVLVEATAFRSIGRIPCVVWYNKKNGATLSRASQPKVGMSKNTSPADESLVAGISSSSLLRDFLHIVDCRPMSNALANRAKGYGVESSTNYRNCEISFMNIPNIHAMRESMKKLKALCLSPSCDNLQWLGNIEDTKWLYYIRQLLKSALHITSLLRDGESVLLHCSHGWDRTSQLSALAQLFLDPFYRTWKGFQILIEKEWLSFGHPFQLRLSHGEKADSQESPIFLQFLDCVYQLVRLFPSYFEFNEGLLLVLVDALYSCRFGTFLLDCRKLRHEADLPNRTASVWTWVNGLRSFLTEETFVDNQVLAPPVSVILKNATLWNDVYMRWSVQHFTPHDPIKLKQNFTQDHTRILSWQLPQGTRRVLNEKLASKYQEAKILQRLRDRIAELEKN